MKREITLLLGDRGLLTNDWRALPLTEVMNAFIKDIPAEKDHTRRAYRSDLNFLLAYMGRKEKIHHILLGDMTPRVIEGFLEHRIQHGDAPTTAARRMGAIRAFDSFVAEREPMYACPSRRVELPSIELRAFEGITDKEARKLTAAAYELGEGRATKLRNGVAVELLLSTGLRANELITATEGQLSKCGGWIRNHRCKGGHFRDVYIPIDSRVSLFRWMNERDRILARYRLRTSLPYPLLVSDRAASAKDPASFRMDMKTLWRIVVYAAEAAGLRHIHPHMLRHARAHEILDVSGDIRLVAQALGHRSLQTTMRYTQRSQEKIAERLEHTRRKREG